VNVVPDTPVHFTISLTLLSGSASVKYISSPALIAGKELALATDSEVADDVRADASVDFASLAYLIVIVFAY